MPSFVLLKQIQHQQLFLCGLLSPDSSDWKYQKEDHESNQQFSHLESK